MGYAWGHWRLMRAAEDAPELFAGRYIVVRVEDQGQPTLRARVVVWAFVDLDTQLPATLLRDVAPHEQARVRYLLDYHPNDAEHEAKLKALENLGSTYWIALYEIPKLLYPDDPSALLSPLSYGVTSPASYLQRSEVALPKTQEEAYQKVWAAAVEAKEKLNEAEHQLFGG